MKRNRSVSLSIYNLTFMILLLAYLVYVCFFTDLLNHSENTQTNNWSSGWVNQTGEEVTCSRVKVGVGEEAVFTKQLPLSIGRYDCFCFISHNSNVVVTIDGTEVYSFESEENFTGYGYGDKKHSVGFSEADAGKEISVKVTSSFKSKGTGYIDQVFIGNDNIYSRHMIKGKIFDTVLSLIIIVYGFLMVGLHIALPKDNEYPYSLFAFGVSSVLMGLWCLLKTGYLQLVSGSIVGYRVMDYFILLFAAYPVICLGISFLVRKKKIFQQAAFFVWIIVLTAIVSLRFGFGLDMHNYIPVLNISYMATFAYLIFLAIWDIRYCKNNNISKNRKYFFFGSVCVVTGSIADILLYFIDRDFHVNNGTFTRIGLVCFIFTSMLQFFYWWTGERKNMLINNFINKMIKYAVSTNNPEDNINKMLTHIGEELSIERAFIFEENGDGTYTNTYEWVAEGLTSKSKEFVDVPLDGYIGKVYQDMDATGHAIIEDVEQLKAENIDLYNILRENGVENIVAGVLEANGEFRGIFGVENIKSDEKLTDISEAIKLLSYFFGQLIIQRDNNLKLIGYGYNDLMTDVGNRRAFERFEDEELDKDGTYGFVMCDINGLKAVNDTQGHEAGDALIKGVCQSLVDTFGKMNVFRMGGDEFVVVSHVKSEGELEAKVNLAKKFIEMEKRSASIGYVFCENGSIPYEEVKVEADKRMYQEKQLYYSGRNERRKRD